MAYLKLIRSRTKPEIIMEVACGNFDQKDFMQGTWP